MNSFRTVVTAAKQNFQISHQSRLVSIGSCFSENIGKKFQENKFRININPFGQQYNPLSIAHAINLLLENKPFTERDLVQHDELWHSFAHHGSYSKTNKAEMLSSLNAELNKAADDLLSADILFLTFGTAHVFELNETGKVVSNCHKMPAGLFNQRLLTPQEIVEELGSTLQKLHTANRQLKTVLTVSPVRYFAFGHYENSVSKAHLFTAMHQLQQQQPDLYYFPAYEMVIDDLRDYRFYAEDMLHPNRQATEYVWERLCETLLHKNSLNLIKEIAEVVNAANHRPRNSNTEAHRKFVEKYLERIKALKQKQAFDFSEEEKLLLKHLHG
ncbi:MAG: GSCFA domain-containing protein [Chitinophagales bacterium]|nr:GSCFA domain-containing protein [Chitinophagales bacterium]